MATMEVEVFACERYRPMAGWSSDYLLPTDQHAYRVRGKKGGWTKLTDAEEALLAPGWAWEEVRGTEGESVSWEVDPGGQPADPQGWSYGVNFTSTYEGSMKSSMQMFTRWRRLVRMQTFAGLESLARLVQLPVHVGCPNYDLEHAEKVGRHLQEALAAASLYADWSLSALVKLKWQLVERLSGAKGADKFVSLEGALTDFVGVQRPMASRLTEVFKGADDATVNSRVLEVDARFPQAEREALAVLAMRRFAPEHVCSAGTDEAHECFFAPVLCEHVGCGQRFTTRASAAHDAVCPFKRLACSKCGEEVPRGEMLRHNAAACPKREAACCYASVGCVAPLAHCDVQAHLDECTQAHMLMLLQTVEEQRTLIRTLTARIETLEGEREASAAFQTAQAAIVTRLDSLETKVSAAGKQSTQDTSKVLKDATAVADKKASAAGVDARRHADSAVAALRAEMVKVQAETGAAQKSVAGLEKRLEPLLRERSR